MLPDSGLLSARARYLGKDAERLSSGAQSVFSESRVARKLPWS